MWGKSCTLPSLLGPSKHWQAERWGSASLGHFTMGEDMALQGDVRGQELFPCHGASPTVLDGCGVGVQAHSHPLTAAQPQQGLTASNSAWSSSGRSLVS